VFSKRKVVHLLHPPVSRDDFIHSIHHLTRGTPHHLLRGHFSPTAFLFPSETTLPHSKRTGRLSPPASAAGQRTSPNPPVLSLLCLNMFALYNTASTLPLGPPRSLFRFFFRSKFCTLPSAARAMSHRFPSQARKTPLSASSCLPLTLP